MSSEELEYVDFIATLKFTAPGDRAVGDGLSTPSLYFSQPGGGFMAI